MIDDEISREFENSGAIPAGQLGSRLPFLSVFGDLGSQLKCSLEQLELESKRLQIAPLEGRDWFDLLIRKLLPQLADNSFLIVAVVGGTNIGKSVVFNHIAGFRASSSSPLA